MPHLLTSIRVSNPLAVDENEVLVCVVNQRLFENYLMITRKVADKLGLKEKGKKEIILGQGSVEAYGYIEQVKIDFRGRQTIVDALITEEDRFGGLGDNVMKALDLEIVESPKFELTFNPNTIDKWKNK